MISNDIAFDTNGDFDVSRHLYTPDRIEISSTKDSSRILAVRECITEINGSTAISGYLANGWSGISLRTISIAPMLNDSVSESLGDGLDLQLAVAGGVLRVDRELDREIDSELSGYYRRFTSSEI